jgi:hypothetical protein
MLSLRPGGGVFVVGEKESGFNQAKEAVLMNAFKNEEWER